MTSLPNQSPSPRVRTVHVVSHTHWDREWYHTAARFRMRLVGLVDGVLAGDAPFLLDGQAIVLADYLAWRPEQQAAVKEALAGGRLQAGPWYVLADNLLVSGEAIVRNLEAGRRALNRLGATAPPVAYCPDSFGHPAAMPLIAREFGLEVGVVWRGLGGAAHPRGDSMQWRAPDGTTLPIWHLPPDGYEYGSALPSDGGAQQRWQQLRALYDARAATEVVLLTNGADHHALQPDVREAVEALATAAARDGVAVVPSTLSAWAAHFAKVAAALPLPVLDGELRDSYGYTWTLSGTAGTRSHQKRRNARLERGLLRDVEPWVALARLQAPDAGVAGRDAQLGGEQLAMLLQRTWENLLTTHPHDTLCGCSIDEVARRMDVVQDEVASMGQELRQRALQLVVGHDAVAARQRPLREWESEDWRCVLLRNRAPRWRGGLARVRLRHTVADAPVGPGSGNAVIPPPGYPDRLSCGEWTCQVLRSRTLNARRESPQHYPDNDLVQEQETLVWVPPVPASGVVMHGPASFGAIPCGPSLCVSVHTDDEGFAAENGRVRLAVQRDRGADGAWHVTWRCDDRGVADVISVVTQEDHGDTYTPSPRGEAERLVCRAVRWLEEGPLRATLRLTWETAQPSRRRGYIGVHTDLSVTAESQVLLCDVHGTVARSDQKLQIVWHTGLGAGVAWADAAFGPVRRDRPQAPATSREAVPAGMPMHRWATWANALAGATLISDGLTEVEMAEGRVALTLVRSVGELSRADLPERPGHAGWPVPTPQAQCQGPFHAQVGMMWHGPMNDDTRARIRDACDDVLLPLVGESWRDYAGATPHEVCGVQLSGEAFEQSAVTVSQVDPQAIILRAVNMTGREAVGAWQMPDAGPWEVTPVRMDETPIADTWTSTGHIPLHAIARGVLTMRVRRADPPRPLPAS